MEIWADIPGYDGVYQVSSMGNVRRGVISGRGHKAGRSLKLSRKEKGYVKIGLWREKKYTRKAIHVAVLEAFVGPRPPGHEASHKNGIPYDNRLENLCWETPMQNSGRKRDHGTIPCGEKSKNAKLTAHQVMEIRDRRDKGELTPCLAKEFGVNSRTISKIALRKIWAHI